MDEKAKRSPNLTKLLTAKMPKAHGQKGSVPPRKRKKKNDVQLHKSFTDVLNETMVSDETSHDHSCEPSASREDCEPSSSREEIELTSRNENCCEISGGGFK